MVAVRGERNRELFRTAARSVPAGVAARDSGARAGYAARPRTARRSAPPPPRRDDTAHLRVDAPIRRAGAGRLRPSAADERLDRGVLDTAEPGLLQQEMIVMARLSKWTVALACAAIVGSASAADAQQKPGPLKIGVTLHPYYSWTSNIVGDLPGYEV